MNRRGWTVFTPSLSARLPHEIREALCFGHHVRDRHARCAPPNPRPRRGMFGDALHVSRTHVRHAPRAKHLEQHRLRRAQHRLNGLSERVFLAVLARMWDHHPKQAMAGRCAGAVMHVALVKDAAHWA